MSELFDPTTGWGGSLDAQIRDWQHQPWYPAAQRMFTEWRDTRSPNVCTLAYARFLEACEAAIDRLRRQRFLRSTMIDVQFLSNGHPIRHYRKRVTLADFGL